jgi:hypothetical protein
MRSLCTASLIALIGLASYGNAAQIPTGIWCTQQTTAAGYSSNANISIPDPPADAPEPQCSPSSVLKAGECLLDPGFTPAGAYYNNNPYNGGVLTLIQNARNADTSIPQANKQLVLPNNFPNEYQNLTQDEKVVVLINLERTARGLSMFHISDQYPPAPYGHPALTWLAHNHAALLAEFYELNQGGSNLNTDGGKLVHSNSIDGNQGDRINALPGFTQGTLSNPLYASPVGEVETDTQNAENAVYTWLYRDSANSPPWGHRHALLGVGGPGSGGNCYTQIGAGFAASPNQAVYAQITQGSPPKDVAPPEFFYVADLVGQEGSWVLPSAYPDTLTPSPLAATVVYNNSLPSTWGSSSNPPTPAPPPGAPPPDPGSLSVYIGIQPYPFSSAYANSVNSVTVYGNPTWVDVCTSGLLACPSPLNYGTLGSTGTECTPDMAGTLGTGWAIYTCTFDAGSVPSTAGLVVIVRDAYDQFVCLQPPFPQAEPLNDTVPIPNANGTVTTKVKRVTTDSCGVAPLPPFDPVNDPM